MKHPIRPSPRRVTISPYNSLRWAFKESGLSFEEFLDADLVTRDCGCYHDCSCTGVDLLVETDDHKEAMSKYNKVLLEWHLWEEGEMERKERLQLEELKAKYEAN